MRVRFQDYPRAAPATETRYTKPCDSSAMARIRGAGVVGVASSVSSRPAPLTASRIGAVSSIGRSGTSRPAMGKCEWRGEALCRRGFKLQQACTGLQGTGSPENQV